MSDPAGEAQPAPRRFTMAAAGSSSSSSSSQGVPPDGRGAAPTSAAAAAAASPSSAGASPGARPAGAGGPPAPGQMSVPPQVLQAEIMSRLDTMIGPVERMKQMVRAGMVSPNPRGLPLIPLPIMATLTGSLDALTFLAAEGANMKLLLNTKRRGYGLLQLAALLGYPDIVAFLVDKAGIPVNVHVMLNANLPSGGGAAGAGGQPPVAPFESPLHAAVAGGHIEIVRLLVERGANPHELILNSERNVVHAACAGIRPYVSDLLDITDLTLGPVFEQSMNITSVGSAWPRGCDPMWSGNDVAATTRTTADYARVLEFLLEKQRVGFPDAADEDAAPVDCPPAVQEYVQTAIGNCNVPALRYFVKRGWITTPLQRIPPGFLEALPDPALLRFATETALGGDLMLAFTSLLPAGVVRGMLQLGCFRMGARPANTFKMQVFLPSTVLVAHSVATVFDDMAACLRIIIDAYGTPAPPGTMDVFEMMAVRHVASCGALLEQLKKTPFYEGNMTALSDMMATIDKQRAEESAKREQRLQAAREQLEARSARGGLSSIVKAAAKLNASDVRDTVGSLLSDDAADEDLEAFITYASAAAKAEAKERYAHSPLLHSLPSLMRVAAEAYIMPSEKDYGMAVLRAALRGDSAPSPSATEEEEGAVVASASTSTSASAPAGVDASGAADTSGPQAAASASSAAAAPAASRAVPASASAHGSDRAATASKQRAAATALATKGPQAGESDWIRYAVLAFFIACIAAALGIVLKGR